MPSSSQVGQCFGERGGGATVVAADGRVGVGSDMRQV
jgi:hypothetical protein